MSIRVVNLRNYVKRENEELVKIDRSSIFGNPYYMKNEGEREKVCVEYEKYFKKKCDEDENTEFNRKLLELIMKCRDHDVALGCWCHPKQCHGDFLKTFIEHEIENFELMLKTIIEVLEEEKENGNVVC